MFYACYNLQDISGFINNINISKLKSVENAFNETSKDINNNENILQNYSNILYNMESEPVGRWDEKKHMVVSI